MSKALKLPKPRLFAVIQSKRLRCLALLIMLASPAAGSQLAAIHARHELVAGVRDSQPPFGFIQPGSLTLVGYDVDIAAAIAKRLGVALKTVPVTSDTRVPELLRGNIDLIAAAMSRTPEREQQVDFSFTYFVSGQKVMVKRKSGVRNLDQLAGKRVSAVLGSLSEQNIQAAVPGVKTISFSDLVSAFAALERGEAEAMTSDEVILLKLRARNPDDYVLLEKYISVEPYGLGIRKGEAAFLKEINRILAEMEKSGEAQKIFNAWFGPDSPTPLKRTFKFEKPPG